MYPYTCIYEYKCAWQSVKPPDQSASGASVPLRCVCCDDVTNRVLRVFPLPVDVDECYIHRNPNDPPCKEVGALCINTPGNYTCIQLRVSLLEAPDTSQTGASGESIGRGRIWVGGKTNITNLFR